MGVHSQDAGAAAGGPTCRPSSCSYCSWWAPAWWSWPTAWASRDPVLHSCPGFCSSWHVISLLGLLWRFFVLAVHSGHSPLIISFLRDWVFLYADSLPKGPAACGTRSNSSEEPGTPSVSSSCVAGIHFLSCDQPGVCRRSLESGARH